MSFFQKHKESLITKKSSDDIKKCREKKKEHILNVGHLFVNCERCKASFSRRSQIKHQYVCPECGFHSKMPSGLRLKKLLDAGSIKEMNQGVIGCNPLGFPEYNEKITGLQEKTGLVEAVVTATGTIEKEKCVVCVLDSRFLMGSMGVAVGEKITRAIEYATENRLPIIIFSASGGARMQEGIFSLMQMAKTAGAIEKHKKAGQLFISYMTNPTTGGVTASFAGLGDIILAEPEALIGFAGPRVIAQTIQQKLPEGFQSAEYLQEHGFVDAIVTRDEMRSVLATILRLHGHHVTSGIQDKQKLSGSYGKKEQDHETTGVPMAAYDHVKHARNQARPNAREYISALFTDFIEMRGDRRFKDDRSVVAGICSFHGRSVTVLGTCKGRTLNENMERNFGMPNPDGYRKVLRMAEQAERFHRPIITFIDTPGAYPGIEAEARGQWEAIASCLSAFSGLSVPVIAVIIGEGGSGGALALGVANTIIMLEHAVYSVLSPEGFASILWKDSSRSAEACELMKLTADDLRTFGICDYVVAEPEGGVKLTAEGTPADIVKNELEALIRSELERYEKMNGQAVQTHRYKKYRTIGTYLDT